VIYWILTIGIGVMACGAIAFTILRLREWTAERIERERDSQAALREALEARILQALKERPIYGRHFPCTVLQHTFVDKRVLGVYLGHAEAASDTRADVVLHTDIADLLGSLLTAQGFRIEPGCEPRLTNQ
jgi:hypothetical protein